ncbi:MAG TPA: 50S ribosomal protein L9 [Chlamydiales bacterium]|nr:50S ribosomal protein L9 [Chlamydiales bacterium]
MKQQLLLLNDVDSLGRKGEIVTAKPGYIRNFLLPRGLAVIASTHTLRKQETLRKEREQQAIVDRQESDLLAKQLEGLVLETKVKVDPEGHMYGSVTPNDVARLFVEKGFAIDRKYIQINRPIKETGMHKVPLKLKEGVLVNCQLSIIPEGLIMTGTEAVTAPIAENGADISAE